jgi:16S rRNA (adenine1518-N6/adenine1519-N6)-dimethyltransferase
MIENIATYKRTKEIIDKYEFTFQKRFGQNFIIDYNIIDKIIEGSDIGEDDYVIEIGPGIGSLTQALLEHVKKVIAIEIDKKLIPVLKDTLQDYKNLVLINEDVLKVNLNEIIEKECDGKAVKIVANLPYYITTPIIMGLFEQNCNIKSITVMVQKEVAQRMQANPGSKEYGALSLAIKYYSQAAIIANVSPSCFIPKPKVGSAVIRLDKVDYENYQVKDSKILFAIIKGSFNQRRKTLVNSLSNQGNLEFTKEEIIAALEKIGLMHNIRGEALTLEDYIQLTNYLI